LFGGVGLQEEGIYRKPGVLSKAGALMKDCIGTYVCVHMYPICLFIMFISELIFHFLEKGRLSKISLDDEIEYDTKTVASAVKMYFR